MSKITKTLSENSKNHLTNFIHKTIVHVIGTMGLLVSLAFFTATFDTAQVKLTLFQIGSTLLIALWSCLKITQKQNPFSSKNALYLLPFVAYIGWNIVSFSVAPYHLEAFEEFIRFILYGFTTFIVATEFNTKDLPLLTKYIVTTAGICTGYATLQVINNFVPGADPMPWQKWFGTRIFSTQANPNFYADFAVFSSFIIAGFYLVNKRNSLLILLGLSIISLFFTQSKGAWLSYVITSGIGVTIYINCLSNRFRNYTKRFNLAIACLILISLIGVGFYSTKRIDSVNFRAFTWLSTYEMIKDSPIIGTGIGSFKIIYTAYKRPQIFYIENSHNTETQHAENEFLEQWAVSGTVGLIIFLWLICYLSKISISSLKAIELAQTQKFYLFGYFLAFSSMILHSLFDVSIHFASSGFFLALLMGILFSFSLPPSEIVTTKENISSSIIAKVLCIVLLLTTLFFFIKFGISFYDITQVLTLKTFGDFLLIAFSWIVFIGCLLGVLFIYIKMCFYTKTWAIPLILLLALFPMKTFYSWFLANHFYSVGVSLINSKNPEGAIGFFTKAIDLNPLQTEYRQFRANILATLLNLSQNFSTVRGDKTVPSNDYERALKDFNSVESRSPNHALLHHNKGQLYFNMALKYSDFASKSSSQTEYDSWKKQAIAMMDKAKISFERSLLVDPVNAQTYSYLVQIAILERNPNKAQEWIDAYQKGPKGVVEPIFLEKHQKNPLFASLQQQVNALRVNLNR